jgi:hypothetical protein
MRIILFIVILTTAFNLNSFAQCCSAGNPAGGDGKSDDLNKNDLRIYASYKHSLSKDYYTLDKKTEIPYIDRSYYDYTALSITYGLSPRLTVNSELGYFFDKTQVENISSYNNVIQSHGLGDIAVNIRYKLIKTVKPVTQLLITAGVKLPVGAFEEEMDGITIPISLQPSSGALKYNLSIFYTRKRNENKYGWQTYAQIELSNTIDKEFLIYHYGSYFQYSLAGSYAFTKKLLFIGNVKLEWRGNDIRELETVIESTGSRVVFLNPQILYSFKNKWSIVLMSDIPVYKYVNGSQLTNKYSLSIGLYKTLSLSKKPPIDIPSE